MDRRHRSYYIVPDNMLGRDAVAEVMFGIYPDPNAPFDGTLMAEMGMRWRTLRGDDAPSARLEVYDESWAALSDMPDLLLMLGSMSRHERMPRHGPQTSPLTVEEFILGLESLGFARRG